MKTLRDEKADLFDKLRTALAIELGTIPPYMMALLSIKKPGNRVAAEIIRTVMIEEMLHMTLVGNVTNALGGSVQLGPKTIPRYPLRLEFEGKRFKDRDFDVNLAPFSPASLQTFLDIELPDGFLRRPKSDEASKGLDIDGLTIGDFYRGLLASLEAHCNAYGEQNVFSGDPALQIHEGYYWSSGGKPIMVTDLESAREAIGIIIDQGEGGTMSIDDGDRELGEPFEVAHFFRFREIHFGRRYLPTDKPHELPSGERFEVDYEAVFPFKKNPRASDYRGTALEALNTRFNREYTLMLMQIQEAMSGTPRTLYTAIMNGMHGLTAVALEMVATPIPGDPEGRHGAPTFEWQEP